VRAGTLACRLHLWEFELASGACRSMPARPIPTYAAYERDGRVLVDVSRPRGDDREKGARSSHDPSPL